MREIAGEGVEPSCLAAAAFETAAFTDFATPPVECAQLGSNQHLRDYESPALTN